MPTYEYGCGACGHAWEAEQRITETALKDCPACGKPEARRMISGGSFQLKGGGWYADGYGNSKKSSPSESGSSSSSS
jgi:putative FmdB family regulatory protein